MQPYDYQDEAIESVFNYFEHNGGNPVVAMPTGTGKSVVIAFLVMRIFARYPRQRILILTHVKELLEQNADKLYKVWPMAPVGFHSAGLGSKDTIHPIIFGGIQSVVNNIEAFGYRDLILIDEAHLVSPQDTTSYRKVIDGLREMNPNIKVIGFTATPFRVGQGMITDGTVFDDICCNMCTPEKFNWFIEQGRLSPLVPQPTRTTIDVSGVTMVRGDFKESELSKVVDRDEISRMALSETLDKGQGRRSGIVFASGVEHAEHITAILREYGESVEVIHSKKMPAKVRAARILDHKEGRLKWLVNNGVLTTGYDNPILDIIVMLRPTMSPGLWVQMLGRGTRVAPGKSNCLVLDFAGNTPRLGPVNDPKIPRTSGQGGGEVPVKMCELCGTYHHTTAKVCVMCGFEFKFQIKIEQSSGTHELIKCTKPQHVSFDVLKIIYNKHIKPDKAPSIKISYFCGLQMFTEYVCPEHGGFAAKKAREFWRQRHIDEPPEDTDTYLQLCPHLKVPRRIKVHINKKHPEIISHEF